MEPEDNFKLTVKTMLPAGLPLNVPLPPFEPPYQETLHTVSKYIILAVAIFGVVGNVINIYVLTSKRTRRWSRGALEVVAYTGLVALAASDMMYCLMAAIDAVFVDRRQYRHYDISIALIIQYCSKYVLNVFSYFSTWMTVLMALNRYLAICHPIYTRICVRQNLLWKVMLLIFLCWGVLLLPEQLENKICYSNCEDVVFYDFSTNDSYSTDYNDTNYILRDCGCISTNGSGRAIYQLQDGPTSDTTFLTASQAFNNIVGFIIPALSMIYCNYHIVMKLRETQRMRRELCGLEIREPRSSNPMPDKPVTYSLFLVVVLFLILVTPSEVLNIIMRYYHLGNSDVIVLNTVGEIANIMNTLNFATNFLLYCLVNVHFRRALSLRCCTRKRNVSREMSFKMCARATSVDLL